MFMTSNMTMIKVNIADAKARFSEYLKRVEAGETVLLARRNQPIAEIRPLARPPQQPRPVGLAAGEFEVPEDFDAPLPEAILKAFEGR